MKKLNAEHGDVGRVIAWESDSDGWHAILDTYALLVATLEDINESIALEESIRAQNREWLANAPMKSSKTA